MPTKQEIIENGIVACPIHTDNSPANLGVCKDCDEITNVWADYLIEFSNDLASGKQKSDVDLRWAPGYGNS